MGFFVLSPNDPINFLTQLITIKEPAMRIITIITLTLLLSISLSAKKKGAPPMASGAEGDRTCQTSKCHGDSELNSGTATISIEGLPEVYTANEIYEITLKVEQSTAKVFGFQATVADGNGKAIGTLTPAEGADIQILDPARYNEKTDRQYLTHTLTGIDGPKKGVSPTWKIQWQAPDSTASISSFYFAFNAGNGNKKKTGDYIYTRSIQVKPAKN